MTDLDRLRGLWTTTLGVDDARRDDDFFASGGDSIAALQFVGQLEEDFGVDPEAAADFFETPTYGFVADLVTGRVHG